MPVHFGFAIPARPLLTCGLAFVMVACSERSELQPITVVGTDYAFSVPETLQPGRTILTFDNPGTVDHEMVMHRLKPGVTLADVMGGMESDADPDEFIDESVGVLFASPGRESGGQLVVNLESGATYVLLCFLQDGPDDPPHSALGMLKSVTVP